LFVAKSRKAIELGVALKYTPFSATTIEAEALLRRSLAIREKSLGTEHPKVGESLFSYAILLRKTKRKAQAREMETRAAAILERHRRSNLGPLTVGVSDLAREKIEEKK
jgi:Tetratricopeptide repeat